MRVLEKLDEGTIEVLRLSRDSDQMIRVSVTFSLVADVWDNKILSYSFAATSAVVIDNTGHTGLGHLVSSARPNINEQISTLVDSMPIIQQLCIIKEN